MDSARNTLGRCPISITSPASIETTRASGALKEALYNHMRGSDTFSTDSMPRTPLDKDVVYGRSRRTLLLGLRTHSSLTSNDIWIVVRRDMHVVLLLHQDLRMLFCKNLFLHHIGSMILTLYCLIFA